MQSGGMWIQRYQGRLDAAAMASDLSFESTTDPAPTKDCFYLTSEGTCPSEDEGCVVARGLRRASWLVMAMGALLLVALLRRRRRT